MKRSFKFSLIAATLMAVTPMGVSVVNKPATVQASQRFMAWVESIQCLRVFVVLGILLQM